MLSRVDQQRLNKLMVMLCTAAAYGSREMDGAAFASVLQGALARRFDWPVCNFGHQEGVNLLKLAATIKQTKNDWRESECRYAIILQGAQAKRFNWPSFLVYNKVGGVAV